MLRLIDRNATLLIDEERRVVEQFRVHVSDLEYRHLQDPPKGAGREFPIEVELLFGEHNGA